MSSGSAVDPADSLLLVAAKKVDQSDESDEDDPANEKVLRVFFWADRFDCDLE